jgi:hypothetical protein
MHEIPNIITERVDDIPLLHQMQQRKLPTLIDTHFPAHGNWYGRSLGWVSTIWLSAILSRGTTASSMSSPGWPIGCNLFGGA